jgi:hypothetical protein
VADNSMKVVQKYVDMAKYVYIVLRNFPLVLYLLYWFFFIPG